MEEKITLDVNSFKALASETRVSLLKKLKERRATASELAAGVGVSVQAASEHLEKMKEAGLVRKIDEGRKWIYFELTEKGTALVQPSDSKKIWVLLGISLIAITAGLLQVSSFFAQPQAFQATPFAAPKALDGGLQSVALPEAAGAEPTAETVRPATEAGGNVFGFDSFDVLLIALGAVLFGFAAAKLLERGFGRRKAL